MFKILQHLLPDGRAFSTTASKYLRSFIEGVSASGDDVKTALDDVYDEKSPATTDSLDEWNDQFGLPSSTMSTAQIRSRLDAAWKAQGGQSPSYIQTTLRAAGFDVYVHEWWVPGTEPAIGVHGEATARNPFNYLRETNSNQYNTISLGDDLAMCGEDFAMLGNSTEPIGYPLVNKVYYSVPDIIVMLGEDVAVCGETDALLGNALTYTQALRVYHIPTDESTWRHFIYIGGQTFGDIATIPAARRDEFEALCLKICPLQLWIGLIVTYG